MKVDEVESRENLNLRLPTFRKIFISHFETFFASGTAMSLFRETFLLYILLLNKNFKTPHCGVAAFLEILRRKTFALQQKFHYFLRFLSMSFSKNSLRESFAHISATLGAAGQYYCPHLTTSAATFLHQIDRGNVSSLTHISNGRTNVLQKYNGY